MADASQPVRNRIRHRVQERLLTRMFPRPQLPRCFSAENLRRFGFEYYKNFKESAKENRPYQNITYFASTSKSRRRQFGIPHPAAHFFLWGTIKENWTRINDHLNGFDEKNSIFNERLIRTPGDPHSTFELIHDYEFNQNTKLHQDHTAEERNKKKFIKCEFVALADISYFYPSIYTHSIPWALENKKPAQLKRDERIWYNKIDKALRNTRGGRTNGILIGPYVSAYISEIILCRIDRGLSKYANVTRYNDDYRCFARSEMEASQFIDDLARELHKYDLKINFHKTKIVRFNEYLPNLWTGNLLRSFPPSGSKVSWRQIEQIIDFALDLSNNLQQQSPLIYAIKYIFSLNLDEQARRIYVQRILKLSLLYPYLLPRLEKYVLGKFVNSFRDIKFNQYLKSLFKNGILGNSAEKICYAIYFSMLYGIEIPYYSVLLPKLLKLRDCLSSTLAYRYSRKFKLKPTIFKKQAEKIKDDQEVDQNWLYMYEFPEILEKNPKHVFLMKLRKQGINFLELD